jgi:hypothetical protein
MGKTNDQSDHYGVQAARDGILCEIAVRLCRVYDVGNVQKSINRSEANDTEFCISK